MKFISALLTGSIALSAALGGISASAAGSRTGAFFMSMHAGTSYAYISEDGVTGEYKNMQSSNGAYVQPYIIDGNTYLPFRFICEIAGWEEYTSSGKLKNNTFKYTSNSSGGRLDMNIDNRPVMLKVDESFTYDVKVDGKLQKREFALKNIDGSLYLPLRYIASILNAETDYNAKTKTIYFANSQYTMDSFIDGDYNLRYEKTVLEGYRYFDNPMMYSELFLKSDGKTIASVSNDKNLQHAAYSCVSRRFKDIYYIKDSLLKVYKRPENSISESLVKFTDISGYPVDIKADMILTEGNHIWGIASSTEGVRGWAFVSALDGQGFQYINGAEGVYNMTYKDTPYGGYVYFLRDDRRTIVRVDAVNFSQTEIGVYDSSWSHVINEARILEFGDNAIVYVDDINGHLHLIPYEGDIYADDHVFVSSFGERILDNCNGESIGIIRSMNFDDINNVLYFTADRGTGSGLYYYDTMTNTIGLLRTFDTNMIRVAIIQNGYNSYILDCNGIRDNDVDVKYSDSSVVIDNIELFR